MKPRRITGQEREAIRQGLDAAWIKWLKKPNAYVRVNSAPHYTKVFFGYPVFVPDCIVDVMDFPLKYADLKRHKQRRLLLFRIWTSRVVIESEETMDAMKSALRDRDWDFFDSLRIVTDAEKLGFERLREQEMGVRDAYLLSGCSESNLKLPPQQLCLPLKTFQIRPEKVLKSLWLFGVLRYGKRHCNSRRWTRLRPSLATRGTVNFYPAKLKEENGRTDITRLN
jgi:hypothetical protein